MTFIQLCFCQFPTPGLCYLITKQHKISFTQQNFKNVTNGKETQPAYWSDGRIITKR